jgi:hypothetical protein
LRLFRLPHVGEQGSRFRLIETPDQLRVTTLKNTALASTGMPARAKDLNRKVPPMNIEVFSHSKYKNAAKAGDDITLIIPDKVYGVFDGATDPTGASYGGESSGRFAARIAAQTIARIAMGGELVALRVSDVLNQVSDAVSAEALRMKASHPPSTTAAIVFDLGDSYRFMLGGDTGVRINGTEVHQHHKLIDRVSTGARIAVFKILSGRDLPDDEAEMTTRSVIFGGLAEALKNNLLTQADVEAVVAAAIDASGLHAEPQVAREFVLGGIRSQQGYANLEGHVLGYASLNGKDMIMDGVADFTLPKNEVNSIEIFSDGYLSLPKGIRIEDWENEFALVETRDFHKLGPYPSVKGSTSQEFCDDRTVISIFRPNH